MRLALAPWGSPPTPLLPKWYTEEFSRLPVPDAIRTLNPSVQTVGELGQFFWTTARAPLETTVLQSLCRLVRPASPPSSTVVIPAGVDHAELVDYPLRNRTRNALGAAGFFIGSDAITVGMLLSTRRIGHAVLIELMCLSEFALRDQHSDTAAMMLESENASGCRVGAVETLASSWSTAVDSLIPLFAAAREFRDSVTIGDALRADLSHIAQTLGVVESLDSIAIGPLVGGRSIADTVIRRLDAIRTTMPSSWGPVIEHRILGDTPKTLDAVGRDLDLTRERVRQLQKEATRRIRTMVGAEVSIVARLLQGKLNPVIALTELEEKVARAFPADSGHSLSVRIARSLLRTQLAYSCLDSVCMSADALDAAEALKSASFEIADDVGLVDEKELRSHLPTRAWEPFFGRLIEHTGLHRVLGLLALRNSGKALVKAAVHQIGRPATKEEIAEIVNKTPAKVGAHLSVIPSIARADKDRWGLVEWIDDIYEGITAEIVQRINEDGGATRLERLLEELPRLFGVSEVSVRMYARTPYFVIHNGYVSVASEPKVSLKELDDVVDGRTDEGVPYWTFGVESRFFDGYSISPFPPELARELGCEPNGTISAEVDYPQGANAVSVSWPLASTTGASVGRISDSLQRLDVKAGDRVRLLVAGPRRVEFRPSPAHKSRMERPSSDILERLKSRQQVF